MVCRCIDDGVGIGAMMSLEYAINSSHGAVVTFCHDLGDNTILHYNLDENAIFISLCDQRVYKVAAVDLLPRHVSPTYHL